MSFATDLKSVGQDLLQQFGQSISFSRTTEGSFVPSTGDVAGESTVVYVAYGAPTNYSSREIDNINILESDLQLWVEANTSGYVPAVGDVANISGQVHRVLNVTKYQAQGIVAVYRLQVRI